MKDGGWCRVVVLLNGHNSVLGFGACLNDRKAPHVHVFAI